MCHRTPVVGIPLSNDQATNLIDARVKGFARLVPWKDLSRDNLVDAVNAVLGDVRYQEAVDAVGRLAMDQPQHPVERAAWWMEYLLRHPGNPGMRSPSLELWWWQYLLLDVLLVLGLAAGLVGCSLAWLVRGCCGGRWRRGKDKQE